MRKLLKSMKTLLLVAAGLCVGASNAWGETTSVGTDNTTGWWTAFSDYYTLSPNQTLTISFKNYTDKSANGNNWIGVVTTDADRNASGYYEYCVLRADNFGWGGAWVYSNLSSYYNWETFKSDMDGATVAMTVTRNGSIVTLHADITKAGDSTPSYWEEYWTACGNATDNIRFFLTTEKGHLTDIVSSIADNGNTSKSAGWGTMNALIDFSNAISDATVAGRKNSMVLSNVAGSNDSGTGYTLGYGNSLTDYLRVGNGTGTVTIPDEELAGDRDEVVISFDYWFGSLNKRNAGFTLYDNSATPVTIASYYDNFYGASASENTFGFEESKITSLGSSSVSNASICVNTNKTRFELHLNYATGKMWAIQYTNGELKQTTTAINIPTTAGKLKSFVVRSNYDNDGRRCWFDNLLIQTKRGDYSTSEVNYTVKFVDGNGTTVKDDDTSRENLAGTAISDLASVADLATFYNDGNIANNSDTEFETATNKYNYKGISAVTSSNDDTPITELVAGAVVTIVYDKHVKYDYAVKQKLGDAAATDIVTGTLWDDETYSYYFPKGIKDGSDYYFTDPHVSSPNFGGTLTKDATTVTINYTIDPAVVFYSEGEDLESKTGTFGSYASISANGTCGVLNNENGNLITSLGAGIYTITARTAGRGDGGRNIYFYKNSVDEGNIILTANPGNYTATEKDSDPFALTETTNILVKGAEGGGSNGRGLDYVIIKKLPDNVSATITAAGWATLYTPCALNFAAAEPKGLEAYTATLNGSTVTLTKVDDVPANTGVVLKGGANTYSIPVIVNSSTDRGDLKGSTTEAKEATEQAPIYILKLNNNDEAQFMRATSGSLAAGKAYLNGGQEAKALTVVFANDPTGIANVNAAETVQPVKRIVNGQLVIEKNGKRYNAAGAEL